MVINNIWYNAQKAQDEVRRLNTASIEAKRDHAAVSDSLAQARVALLDTQANLDSEKTDVRIREREKRELQRQVTMLEREAVRHKGRINDLGARSKVGYIIRTYV